MEYNSDELTSPAWMNNDFFIKVLKSSENDENILISNLELSPATKPGDHFLSIMFRVKVTYSTKTMKDLQISLIVKAEPEEGIKKEMIGNGSLFDIEIKMYSKTIPEMQRLLKIAGDKSSFVPKIFYCSSKPVKVLVFEDISLKQYEMIRTFINLKGTKIVFEKLAKWHACSFYMNADHYEELSSYNLNVYNGGLGENLQNSLVKNMNSFLKLIEKWEGFEKYQDNFENLRNNFIENGKKAYIANTEISGGYNVLNHGDFQYKNMMFKKENGEIEDVIFVDFQLCVYASPAIDVIYALTVVGDNECKIDHRLELINLYYQTFVTTLKKIGFLGKIPTMLDLQIELLKCGIIEVMLTTYFIPFFNMDYSKYSAEELLGTDEHESKECVLNKPEVNNLLRRKIPEFILHGFFD